MEITYLAHLEEFLSILGGIELYDCSKTKMEKKAKI